MKSIPIHLLKALVVTSDSSNLSEAAKVLGITQPGLSKQLQLLEDMLPHKIFVMEGKKKQLTSFGNELVSQLKTKLTGLDFVVHQTCERFLQPEQSTVKIMGRRGILDRLSSKIKFPGRLIFIDAANEDTIKAVLNQSVDLGITYLKENSSELVFKALFVEKFKLIIPKKILQADPLSLKNAFEQIYHLPCLTYKEPDDIFNCVLSGLQLDSLKLNVKRTNGNFESLICMADAGLGWTIVPEHFTINTIKHWTLNIPLKLHPSRQFNLCYRKEMVMAPWLKMLRLEIENCFKEM